MAGWGEDDKARDVATDADQTKLDTAGSSSNNSSSGNSDHKSGKSGEDRWLVVENNELALNVGDGKAEGENTGPGSAQLMQLAAAIKNLPAPAELMPAADGADAPVLPMIEAAPVLRKAPTFNNQAAPTMESIFGFGMHSENNLLSECAVIPTVPENIYNHTIAAVPNFKEKQKPPTNWTFAITNICLLLALAGAAIVEVYVPQNKV